MELEKEVRGFFVCPVCHGDLKFEEERSEGTGFVCGTCQLLYPVVDRIPNFLVEDGIKLADEGARGE